MSGLSDSPEPIKSGVIRRACAESGVCWCSHCHIEPPNPWIRMTGWPWPTSRYAIVWPFTETVLIGMRSKASNWGGIGGGEEHAMLATKKPNVISDIEGRLDNRVEERWRLSLFQLDNCLIRLHVLAFGDENGHDLSVDRCRNAAFHLHCLDDQERISGLNPILFCDQHLDDAARHRRCHVSRLGRFRPFRLRALAAVRRFRHTGQHFLDRFERHLFELVVDT